MFRVRLLGGLRLQYDNVAIELPAGERARCILARLILSNEQELKRSYLAGLFWPNSTESQARTNLRREIHQLREHHQLFKQCINSSRHHVQWLPPIKCLLDINRFTQHYDTFYSNTSADLKLSSGLGALGIYTGELLPGYEHDWIIQWRELLARQWIGLADDVLTLQNELGKFAATTKLATELVLREPLRESIYVELMRAYESIGNPALALQTYHQCAAVLYRELGVYPNSMLESRYMALMKVHRRTGDVETLSQRSISRNAMIGRKVELKVIKNALNTQRSNALLILLTGEAGIGKTRLADSALRQAESDGYAVVRAACNPATGNHALNAIHQWLNTPLFQSLLTELSPWWQSVINATIPSFVLGKSGVHLPADNHSRFQHGQPTQFEALARLLCGSIQAETSLAPRPRVLLVDDLQWADSDFIAFLGFLFNRDNNIPIMLLATQRSEGHADDTPLKVLVRHLMLHDQLVEVPVLSLNSADSEALGSQLLSLNNPLHKTHIDLRAICRWAQGNPFYITETILHLSSSSELNDRSSGEGMPVAPKIYTIIQERLQSISANARLLLQYAAVTERPFSVALLSELADDDSCDLVSILDELWRNRFIRDAGKGDYDFSHDCIRESCIHMLSMPQQCAMHAQIAHALETLHVNTHQKVAAAIASHWSLSNNNEKAFAWFLMAIEHAGQNLQCYEVLNYIDTCIDILDSDDQDLYDISDRARLLRRKGYMLSLIDGFGGPREKLVYQELSQIIEVLKDPGLVFNCLSQIRAHASFDGHLTKAHKYVERQMSIARALNDPERLINAHRSMSFVNFQLGDYAGMLRTSTEGSTIADRAVMDGVIDPESPTWELTMLRAMQGFALHMSGQFDEADQVIRRCSNHQKIKGDDHVLGLVGLWMSFIHLLRQDWNQLEAVGESLQRIGDKTALIKLNGMGLTACAIASIQRDGVVTGAANLRDAISLIETSGENQTVMYWYLDMAFACLKEGHLEEADSWLKKSAEEEIVSGVMSSASRRLRLEAELLSAQQRSTEEVLARFSDAYQMACRQHAVLYQLATLTSECTYRMNSDIDNKKCLRDLARVANGCSKSEHSPELNEARSLLQ